MFDHKALQVQLVWCVNLSDVIKISTINTFFGQNNYDMEEAKKKKKDNFSWYRPVLNEKEHERGLTHTHFSPDPVKPQSCSDLFLCLLTLTHKSAMNTSLIS